MKNYACNKCGSVDVFIKQNGGQTGLYCGDCGAWIKWVGKSELPIVERFIEEQKKDVSVTYSTSTKVNTNIITDGKVELDKDNVLEQMCKQISDFVFTNYNPYTSVIITGDKIQIVEDKIGIPIKRY